jgi:uncharacterized protein involved in exopolysaccharide biosynthesis
MTEQTVSHYEDDEISLQDILVTLAESWKLLVFGPLVAAVLAGALSFLWPKTFESVAIVRLTEEEVALLHASPVLDALIDQFGLLAKADGMVDEARQDLKKCIVFSVDKKNKLTTIAAKAETPGQAQALGNAAIAALLKELQVKGQEKAFLEKAIDINDRAIGIAEDAIESIQRSFKKGALTDQAQESAIKNLSSLSSDMAKRAQEIEELRFKLKGPGEDVFVQRPSLPQRKSAPKRSLVVLITLLASGFVLLLFVFVRKAWLSAAQDAESAGKVAHIRLLLGMGKA